MSYVKKIHAKEIFDRISSQSMYNWDFLIILFLFLCSNILLCNVHLSNVQKLIPYALLILDKTFCPNLLKIFCCAMSRSQMCKNMIPDALSNLDKYSAQMHLNPN